MRSIDHFFRYVTTLFIFIFFLLGLWPVSHAEIVGPPIINNNYSLDLRQGPVLGSARQVGLGGAYIGVAEGIGALRSNAAGVAFRPTRSTDFFDFDFALGVIDLKSRDFDNNGVTPPDYVGHKILTTGLMGQWGQFGVGFYNLGEVIELKNAPKADTLVLNVNTLAMGEQFMDQQLTLGAGLRSTFGKVRQKSLDLTLGKLSSTGWQVGGLWNPERGPLRMGISYASKMNSDQSLASNTSTTPVTINGLIIPQQLILPAEWGLGASYQVTSAPFWKGHPWMVAGDLVLTEASQNAVGVESFLAQKQQSIGTTSTVGFRLGSELETIRDRLRLRAGTYFEPSNFQGVSGRTHATGGFEMRLFHVNFWGSYDFGLSYAVDYAQNYLNQLVSIGFWYFSTDKKIASTAR